MKNLSSVFVLAAFLLFTACAEKKKNAPAQEEPESTHQWTEKNKLDFEKNCVVFLQKEGVENPKPYCDCLLQSSLESYPDPEVAMELEHEHIAELFINSKCLDDLLLIKIEDPWTDEVEQVFLEHCRKGQQSKGVTEENANKYCDCALEEIKKIIPNPQHVISLTEEELQHILAKCNP